MRQVKATWCFEIRKAGIVSEWIFLGKQLQLWFVVSHRSRRKIVLDWMS